MIVIYAVLDVPFNVNLHINCSFLHLLYDKGCDPDVECTAWIREHYVFLLDNLDSVFSGLVGYLYQFEVFDATERDDVRTERTSAKQNERLLSILGRKSPEKTQQFYVALDVTGQNHIRRTISGKQLPGKQ